MKCHPGPSSLAMALLFTAQLSMAYRGLSSYERGLLSGTAFLAMYSLGRAY